MSGAPAKTLAADPPYGRSLTGRPTFLDPETLRPLREGANKRREGLLIGDWGSPDGSFSLTTSSKMVSAFFPGYGAVRRPLGRRLKQ